MRRAFTLAAAGAAMFVLLTTAAMFIYPGGTFSDPTTQGYRFSENFISELGFLTANNGVRNPWGAGLFFLAMNLAGASLVLFFVTFWRLFSEPAWLRWLAGAGTLLGVLAGLGFMGVGFTPADVLRGPHIFFVVWAFRLFPAAVALYTAALFAHPAYPRRGAWLFVIFTACLVGYVLLLELGPAFFTDADGMRVQVAGQKVIVYCSLVCVMLQAWVARGVSDAQPAR